MKKLEVKYLGIIIGHTYDGQTIEFLDNEHSNEIKNTLSEGHTIGILPNRLGKVDENGYVRYDEITEYTVINYLDELLKQQIKI